MVGRGRIEYHYLFYYKIKIESEVENYKTKERATIVCLNSDNSIPKKTCIKYILFLVEKGLARINCLLA